MPDRTQIEWCDTSCNPWPGCEDVVRADGSISPACRVCYAKRAAARLASNPQVPRYKGLALFNGDGRPEWTGELAFVPSELEKLRGYRRPRRIFLQSMGDIAHEKVPLAWWMALWSVLVEILVGRPIPHWIYLLTKRPGNLRRLLEAARDHSGDSLFWKIMRRTVVMTTTEDQQGAEERLDELLTCPASYYGVSAEPVVAPLDLRRWLRPGSRRLHWVIGGGMSGPEATPMHPQWARDLRDQCEEAGAHFFFKQWGAWKPLCSTDDEDPHGAVYDAGFDPHRDHLAAVQINGDIPQECHGPGPDGNRCDHQPAPGSVWMVRVPKKRDAGRLLDGVEWSQHPGQAEAWWT